MMTGVKTIAHPSHWWEYLLSDASAKTMVTDFKWFCIYLYEPYNCPGTRLAKSKSHHHQLWLSAHTLLESTKQTSADSSYSKSRVVAKIAGLGQAPSCWGAMTFDQILLFIAWDAYGPQFWNVNGLHLISWRDEKYLVKIIGSISCSGKDGMLKKQANSMFLENGQIYSRKTRIVLLEVINRKNKQKSLRSKR